MYITDNSTKYTDSPWFLTGINKLFLLHVNYYYSKHILNTNYELQTQFTFKLLEQKAVIKTTYAILIWFLLKKEHLLKTLLSI